MGDNKGQTIFLSVIGIATLLVAIIGATFAYFATAMTGNEGRVSATTAKVGTATFNASGAEATGVIYPGWTTGAKNIEITVGPTDVDVEYTCYLNVTTNTIPDMAIKSVALGADTTASSDTASGVTLESFNSTKIDTLISETNKEIKLFDGIVRKTTSANTVQNVTYEITLPESGTNQTTDNAGGKTFDATVTCRLKNNTVYYTTNADGTVKTTTDPTQIPATDVD